LAFGRLFLHQQLYREQCGMGRFGWAVYMPFERQHEQCRVYHQGRTQEHMERVKLESVFCSAHETTFLSMYIFLKHIVYIVVNVMFFMLGL